MRRPMQGMRAWGLLGIAFLCFLPPPAWAGAFLRPAGEGLFILTGRYLGSDTFVDQNGARHPQPPFSKFELNPYLEYAVSDTLTVGFNGFAEYLRQDAANPFAAGSSLLNNGDVAAIELELFARHALYRKGAFALTLEPLVKLPSWYTSTDLTQQERSSFDAQLGLIGGYGFTLFKKDGFAELGAAYRKRFGNPADQLRADATLGLHFTPRLLALASLNGIAALNAPANPIFTGLGEDDMDLLKARLSAVYALTDRVSLEAGGFQNLYMRNTGDGGGVFVSLWLTF